MWQAALTCLLGLANGVLVWVFPFQNRLDWCFLLGLIDCKLNYKGYYVIGLPFIGPLDGLLDCARQYYLDWVGKLPKILASKLLTITFGTKEATEKLWVCDLTVQSATLEQSTQGELIGCLITWPSNLDVNPNFTVLWAAWCAGLKTHPSGVDRLLLMMSPVPLCLQGAPKLPMPNIKCLDRWSHI